MAGLIRGKKAMNFAFMDALGGRIDTEIALSLMGGWDAGWLAVRPPSTPRTGLYPSVQELIDAALALTSIYRTRLSGVNASRRGQVLAKSDQLNYTVCSSYLNLVGLLRIYG
jgi:hypothetical protein